MMLSCDNRALLSLWVAPRGNIAIRAMHRDSGVPGDCETTIDALLSPRAADRLYDAISAALIPADADCAAGTWLRIESEILDTYVEVTRTEDVRGAYAYPCCGSDEPHVVIRVYQGCHYVHFSMTQRVADDVAQALWEMTHA